MSYEVTAFAAERFAGYVDVNVAQASYLQAVDAKEWNALAQAFARGTVSGPNEQGERQGRNS